MTEEELRTSVLELKNSVGTLTQEWGQFLNVEAQRREESAVERRNRAISESQKAAIEVEEWQKKQSFLSKHGVKIMGFLFAGISTGLAWYGSQIRSEIHAEQRAIEVDEGIASNTKGLADFQEEAKDDINELRLDSVNQTIMIEKGFDRVDKVILTAHTKMDVKDLPEVDPEFKETADEAKRLKLEHEKFGTMRDKTYKDREGK